MSNLPGNPHYEDYELLAARDTTVDYGFANMIATLALAYEQRTANIMSMYKLMRDEGNTDVPECDELARNMATRLGMLP